MLRGLLATATMVEAVLTPKRSAGALRRLAGGDAATAPAALEAALKTEGWTADDVVAAADKSGKSALHFAAWRGHPGCVDVLLDAGLDVNTPATGEFSRGPRGTGDGSR